MIPFAFQRRIVRAEEIVVNWHEEETVWVTVGAFFPQPLKIYLL